MFRQRPQFKGEKGLGETERKVEVKRRGDGTRKYQS